MVGTQSMKESLVYHEEKLCRPSDTLGYESADSSEGGSESRVPHLMNLMNCRELGQDLDTRHQSPFYLAYF